MCFLAYVWRLMAASVSVGANRLKIMRGRALSGRKNIPAHLSRDID